MRKHAGKALLIALILVVAIALVQGGQHGQISTWLSNLSG